MRTIADHDSRHWYLDVRIGAGVDWHWHRLHGVIAGDDCNRVRVRSTSRDDSQTFVIHRMGSVIGAWGGGMIFDMFGNYDLAWRFAVSMGIVAGIVQILLRVPNRSAT